MRDAKSLARSLDKRLLQFIRRSETHAMHQSVDHSILCLDFLEHARDLIILRKVAHKSMRVWQLRDQISRFELEPFVHIRDAQLPACLCELLRNRISDTAFVRQPKNHRRLLPFRHSASLLKYSSIVSASLCYLCASALSFLFSLL